MMHRVAFRLSSSVASRQRILSRVTSLSRPFAQQRPPTALLFRTSAHLGEKPCAKQLDETSTSGSVPITSRSFWSSKSAWTRASINTFRCLIGCTVGDFAALWYLQAFYPDLGMGIVMPVAMACGLSTSMLLETTLLHVSHDKLPWGAAAKTAAGMSFISMLTMEMVENALDYHLTGGLIDMSSPQFWVAAVISMGAGYLAPLPYNYVRLRRYGKACH